MREEIDQFITHRARSIVISVSRDWPRVPQTEISGPTHSSPHGFFNRGAADFWWVGISVPSDANRLLRYRPPAIGSHPAHFTTSIICSTTCGSPFSVWTAFL